MRSEEEIRDKEERFAGKVPDNMAFIYFADYNKGYREALEWVLDSDNDGDDADDS